jgi:hypothetical protein
MLEAIYTGDELGSGGGGGGGSTNPTSGTVPVNQFGTFVDSNIQSDVPAGNGTLITVQDTIARIQADAGATLLRLDGGTGVMTATASAIDLNGHVNVNTHLGLALLRFLGSGVGRPAIKAVGDSLQIRTANDAADTNLQAKNLTASGSFIVLLKSKLESAVDGIFTLLNNAGTSFTRLCFGGNTSAFPALSRAGADLHVKVADDSAFANLEARNVTGRGSVNTYTSFIFDGTTQRGSIAAPTDATITLLNAAGNDFKFLRFGGNTAAFPMISKGSSGLLIKVADDSAFTNIQALDVQATGKVITALDFSVNARSVLTSLVDSNFTLYNAVKGNFNLLQFGGITSAFPALKRSGTELQARLADDSGGAAIRANIFAIDSAAGGISCTTTANIYIGSSASNSVIFGNLAGVAIGKGAALPVASAQLEVVSSTRGFLPPRMTEAQRLAIGTPAVGLIVYQTNVVEGLYINKSTGWTFII